MKYTVCGKWSAVCGICIENLIVFQIIVIFDQFWRDGRVVECGGLENRCPPIGGSGVRIPLSPQSQNKSRASGIVCFNKVPKKACFLKEMKVKQTKTRKGLFWLCKDPPKRIAEGNLKRRNLEITNPPLPLPGGDLYDSLKQNPSQSS
jgi:hypothetical protein